MRSGRAVYNSIHAKSGNYKQHNGSISFPSNAIRHNNDCEIAQTLNKAKKEKPQMQLVEENASLLIIEESKGRPSAAITKKHEKYSKNINQHASPDRALNDLTFLKEIENESRL